MQKFADSGGDVIAVQAKKWLAGSAGTDELISVIEQANRMRFTKRR